MEDRIIVYVAFRDAGALSFDAFAARIGGRAAAVRLPLEPLDLPALRDSGFGFTLGGVPFSATVVPVSLPRSEWEPGVRANVAWPDAAAVMATHHEHVIVAPLGVATDRRNGLRQAVAASLAASAFAELKGAAAVVWHPAATVSAPGDFIRATDRMMTGTTLSELPLDAWMRIAFGRMDGRYAAIARGLTPLLGHDVGVLGDRPDPAGQGALLYDTVGYLIREGSSFADGETVTAGNGDYRARLSPDGRLMWLDPQERH